MTAATAGRIYVYSAPGYDTTWSRTVGVTTIEGHGQLKVGWTGRPDSRVRVKEQTGTVYPDGEGIVILEATNAELLAALARVTSLAQIRAAAADLA